MITYVALDFKSRLSGPSLSQFASNVLARMQGNPKFSSLQPLLESSLQPACERFLTSLQEASDRSRTKVAEKRVYQAALLVALESMAAHINVLPGNSESLILESGFYPRQKAQQVDQIPEQVQGLRVKPGEHSGEVVMRFDRVPQARLYGVEWRLDNSDQWNNGTYSSSARRAIVSGLPNRQDLWFRVLAIGTQQRTGAPSAAVRMFVL